MTIEVQPVGVGCNLSCPYCYQHPIRDAGNWAAPPDVEAMKRAIKEEGGKFTIFGGEPLLTPKPVLEELFKFGFENYQYNAIQTNGALIDEDHIRMFRQYRVGVGFSMDGPEELNDSRWAGSLEKTRAATAKSQANLERLCREGTYLSSSDRPVPPSLIVTVGRHNGLLEHRARLKRWLLDLEALGLSAARLHPLEVDHVTVQESMALTPEETAELFLDMQQFERNVCTRLRFDIFKDIRSLMRGDDRNVTCTWNACDPWTTEAVRGIDSQGGKSNCQRTNKEGIDFKKADVAGWERQLGLATVPYELGGCGGCRFWSMCKGQCPGTGEDQDPRARTLDCAMWMKLFEVVEREMEDYGLVPLSKDPRRQELEQILFQGWAKGKRLSIYNVLQGIGTQQINRSERVVRDHQDAIHGDYTDHGDSDAPAGEPHGDDHGDHTDGGIQVIKQHGDYSDSSHGDYSDHGDSDDPGQSSHADDHGDHTDVENPNHGDSV